MKNKFKRREIFIAVLASQLTLLLFNLAGVPKGQQFIFWGLLFFFAMFGMIKFITDLLDFITPIKENPREVANRAIVKEFFK